VTIKKTITRNYNVLQVRGDMFTFNERYRHIRGNMNYRGFECFNCHHDFEDGEKFGLLITDKGNKTVCNKCVDKISEELEG